MKENEKLQPATLTIEMVFKPLTRKRGAFYKINLPCPMCGKYLIEAKDDSLLECYCTNENCDRDVFSISLTYHTEDGEITIKGW